MTETDGYQLAARAILNRWIRSSRYVRRLRTMTRLDRLIMSMNLPPIRRRVTGYPMFPLRTRMDYMSTSRRTFLITDIPT